MSTPFNLESASLEGIRRERAEELSRELVALAEEDYADLSTYLHETEEIMGAFSDEDMKTYTLSFVYYLLKAEMIQAGIPTPDGGFKIWNTGPQQATERIQEEWNALQRDPELGEIVWFNTTAKGENFLQDTGE
jgi:hypothetical protein